MRSLSGKFLGVVFCLGTLAAPDSLYAEPPSIRSPERFENHGASAHWFFSTLTDVGFMFLRPRVQIGFGRPHAQWLGVETAPIVNTRSVGGMLRLRAESRWLDFRIGGRFRRAFQSAQLDAARTFDHLDLAKRDGVDSQYLSAESQLTAFFPIGAGEARLEGTVTKVMGMKQDMLIFEDSLQVVTGDSFVYGGELNFLAPWGISQRLRAGPALNTLYMRSRDKWVVRTGVRLWYQLYRDLEFRGAIMPTIVSPDSLGFRAGPTFEIGLRHRWASKV